MQHSALLRAMDWNFWAMFREITRLSHGGEVLETAKYSLGYTPRGAALHNMVMVHAEIDPHHLYDAVRQFFGARRCPYSIWLRAHADAALESALHRDGFELLTSMPGMACFREPALDDEPLRELVVRTVDDDVQRADFIIAATAAYAPHGTHADHIRNAFANLASLSAPHIQGLVGYVADRPVASCVAYVSHGVTGLAWIGTDPEMRRRGYAAALTRKAVAEGHRLGGTFSSLQASPAGRSVYERLGFVEKTEYRIFANRP